MSSQKLTMPDSAKTVVYIPARANSSRLPGKALADLGGHPLISYSIRMAKALKGVDHVLVDTDSPEIQAVAEEYGAEAPFLRDAAYAGDKTPLTETVRIFYERIRAVIGPVAKKITMMPTSPFRNIHVLESLMADLEQFLSVKTVLTADVEISNHHFFHNGRLHSLLELVKYDPVQYDWIKEIGYFHGQYETEAIPVQLLLYNNFKYHVLSNPIELIDIDYRRDLDVARRVISENMYDFGMDMG